jgi:hypothetical protein
MTLADNITISWIKVTDKELRALQSQLAVTSIPKSSKKEVRSLLTQIRVILADQATLIRRKAEQEKGVG